MSAATSRIECGAIYALQLEEKQRPIGPRRTVRGIGRRTFPWTIGSWAPCRKKASLVLLTTSQSWLSTKGRHGALYGHRVPAKGADPEVIDQVVRDLDALGFRRVTVKSDQEPAIRALIS